MMFERISQVATAAGVPLGRWTARAGKDVRAKGIGELQYWHAGIQAHVGRGQSQSIP